MKKRFNAAELSPRVKYMREAADVQRLHTVRLIGEYSNGQHTFNMLAMLRLLWPEAPKELIWAIVEHDLPERLVGDIPSPAINLGGFIDKQALGVLEFTILDDLFDEQHFIGLEEELMKWLKGLDLLELLMFCWDQTRLGNVGLMPLVGRIEDRFKRDAGKYPRQIIDLFYECKNGSWTHEADFS